MSVIYRTRILARHIWKWGKKKIFFSGPTVSSGDCHATCLLILMWFF